MDHSRDMAASGTDLSNSPLPGAWRTVWILTLIYSFGMLDRQVAALLIPHIKNDLGLSDLQVSLIQGLAFGMFFMIASPIVGWLVDRVSRRKILYVGVSAWSLGAVCSGLARSFGQLFGARATVGAFEATINPTTYSLLGDLFPPRKLALPLSVFVMGGNIGTALSFVVGGAIIAWAAASPVVLPFLGQLHGWQLAFIITGLPGLILASAALLAVEPKRSANSKGAATKNETGFGDMWTYVLRHKRFYLGHTLGFAFVMAFIVGLQSWNAAYLSRTFQWDLSKIGYVLGWTQLGCAIAGLALHGWIVDKLYSRGIENAHLLYFVGMALIATPAGIFAYLSGGAVAMVVCYNIAYFCLMGFAGIGPAALQIATPANLRGKASAIYMVILSVIATILAPIAVAALTDLLFGNEAMLGRSMAIFAGLTGSLAVAMFLWAASAMRQAVADAKEQQD